MRSGGIKIRKRIANEADLLRIYSLGVRGNTEKTRVHNGKSWRGEFEAGNEKNEGANGRCE